MNNEELTVRLWQEDRAHDETRAALATAERERDEARAELASMRADLAALTARMEIEIPDAAEAVRARTIAECVGLVDELAGPARWGTREADAYLLRDTANALRALVAPQPTPTESADVDPAAGALR